MELTVEKFHWWPHKWKCIRCISQTEFSVIKIPMAVQQRLKREKLKERRKQREQQVQNSRMGNKKVPIITCRRSEFNYYYGQSYNKFSAVPLASKGWLHKKAAGDYFTINSHGSVSCLSFHCS
ncbi:putative ATP-dependent RNA helicase DDX28 [Portunus trituberculatus]|uniref:Putative ATP-dependent RNA helicase DDX28 n=1 Tax=Portunus trituberculatus TaxID=210409 RepID=A0A5B7E3W1_PORTR|nr:putative ATP-dependent RNA helicase DDX28 [Portunus trituberculatus]